MTERELKERLRRRAGKLDETLGLPLDSQTMRRIEACKRKSDAADFNDWLRTILLKRLPEYERACECLEMKNDEVVA